MKLYQQIASTITAMQNCRKTGNQEWYDKHEYTLEKLINLLPSGSEIDGETSIDTEKSNRNKIVINSYFHYMDEHGYYDGWSNFKLVITPSFLDFDMKITGISERKMPGIKDYLYDTYNYVLKKSVYQNKIYS